MGFIMAVVEVFERVVELCGTCFGTQQKWDFQHRAGSHQWLASTHITNAHSWKTGKPMIDHGWKRLKARKYHQYSKAVGIHNIIYIYICDYICIYRLVLASGTAAAVTHTRGGGWGGVGWDVNVHVNLRQQLMLRTRGVGGVGGWDVNVHVKLRQQLMLRTRGVGWGGVGC